MEAAARDAVQGNILFREEGSDSRHPAEGQFHFLFALLSLSVLLKIYCFIRNVEWKRERQNFPSGDFPDAHNSQSYATLKPEISSRPSSAASKVH